MSIINNSIRHIVINRIDAMGDVILTLPTCIYLKSLFPGITISFLARSYTEPIIKCCTAIDHFINYDELKVLPENEQVAFLKEKNIDAIVHTFPNRQIATLSRKAGIPVRIGSTSKNYNFFTCNKLVRLSRRNSDLHEAQQNIYLLRPVGVNHIPTIGSIAYSYEGVFKPRIELPAHLRELLSTDKFNLIIHSKSNGHGAEWDLDNFTKLMWELPQDKFNLFITGSEKEHELFKTWIPRLPPHITDLSGKMSMDELITFVFNADGLLASGTGPLHLAAASGIHTLGLFPITRSINAGRWAPLGRRAEHIESNSGDLSSITVAMVEKRITAWLKK
jgi:ADP-heptose:LPS heptosyltransferase